MSYCFYIRTDVKPAVADVLARIGFPDIVAPDARGDWPDGTLHFYRAGISTRATEVTYVEAVSSDEWPDLLREAEQYRVSPFERQRKWWKPWG